MSIEKDKAEAKAYAIAICRRKRWERMKKAVACNTEKPTPETRQLLVGTAPRACKPQGGAGVSCHDIFRPEDHRAVPAQSVEDERRGQMQCRDCGASVDVIQMNGVWTKRDLDDGTPHKLTCKPRATEGTEGRR